MESENTSLYSAETKEQTIETNTGMSSDSNESVDFAMNSKMLDIVRTLTEISESLMSLRGYVERNEGMKEKVEDVANLFKNEKEQFEQCNVSIKKYIGTLDAELDTAINMLTNHAVENAERFRKALGEQQDILQKRLNEIQVIVDSLNKLSSLADSFSKLEVVVKEQGENIKVISNQVKSLVTLKNKVEKINIKLPRWIKVIFVGLIGIIGVSCLLSIISFFIK